MAAGRPIGAVLTPSLGVVAAIRELAMRGARRGNRWWRGVSGVIDKSRMRSFEEGIGWKSREKGEKREERREEKAVSYMELLWKYSR